MGTLTAVTAQLSDFLVKKCTSFYGFVENRTSILHMVFLWTIGTLFDVTQTDYALNPGKVTVTLKFVDLIVMFVCCLCLIRAIIRKTRLMALPWLAFMVYNLYYIDYDYFVKIGMAIQDIEGFNIFPWICLILRTVGCITRIFMVACVVELFIEIQEMNKLEEQLQ